MRVPALILALFCAAQDAVDASREFVPRLPNGANVDGVPALGHTDPQGTSRSLNTFGNNFRSQGKKWTKALCKMDSDGDGQMNGQELGDPCCVWVQNTNEKLEWTTGVSDPGNKKSMSDPSLWANINCDGSSTPAPAATTKAVGAGSRATSGSTLSASTPSATGPNATAPSPVTSAPGTRVGSTNGGSSVISLSPILACTAGWITLTSSLLWN